MDATTRQRPRWTTALKTTLVVFAVVVALVIFDLVGEADPASGLNPPAGAYAECQTLVELVDSGGAMTTGEALGSLARLYQAAEGGPLETHVRMLLTAVDSGDESRIQSATGAMLDRCANG